MTNDVITHSALRRLCFTFFDLPAELNCYKPFVIGNFPLSQFTEYP